MNKTNRLAWIVNAIYKAKRITFEELASKWKVSAEHPSYLRFPAGNTLEWTCKCSNQNGFAKRL
ncbi:MAG: hypothetical protein Q4F69_00345 [Bacteroidia bacterium]|nr:hypothetical protein [Bacteroidia bacterium]